MRQLKREVKIGNVTIGGKNPIAVQTMLNVPVEDIEGNVAQAKRCEAAGCQILRVTCPSAADAKCIEAVKNLSLIHISEPTRRTPISYAVFCLKKKKT